MLRRPLVVTRSMLVVIGLVLAFSFLGTRGIWDPDEGRYTNVALTMLHSGNWMDPMRNHHTGHWTKPPLTYWMIASSVSLFGQNAWAARLPIAIAYLSCIALVWLIAKRVRPGSENVAAIIYATMAFTTTAGQLVTTDYPLAALQSLAMFGFVLSRFGDERSPPRKVGIIVMWLGFSLGFLNKGPPALTTLVPVMVLSLIFPNPRRSDWKVHLVGILLLAALAFPWYFDVTQRHEGLMDYFLRDEVVERVATDRFKRNGEWYGWLKVYGPTLLLGALPWTLSFLGWIRSTPGILKAYRARQGENVASHEDILLIAWIAIPLLIFCLSRSRLPLYVLPLFTPIAIAIAFTRLRMGLSMPRKHLMFLWITSLLAVRLLAANFPTHKDASAWAAEIRSRATMPVTEIVFIEDMARYGIHLHMEAQIEKAARDIEIATRFNPVFDDLLENEVKESKSDPGTVFVVKQELWKDVSSVVESVGFEPIALGGPFQDRVIFRVKPAVAAH